VTPFTRFILVVFVSMLIGAGLGAAYVKRLQPPLSVPVNVTPPPRNEPLAVYTPVDVNALSGWTEDSVAQALPALKRSCAQFAKLDPGTMIGRDAIARRAEVWQTACRALDQISDGDAAVRAALARDFMAYRVAQAKTSQPNGAAYEPPNDRGTFTGYYEADLKGSLTEGGAYQVPIYGRPRNLVTVNLKDFLPPSIQLPGGVPTSLVGRVIENGELKPYYTRAEIDADGAIADDADVLLWADDPVAVHILHIQGSGRVTLPDGQIMRIGFAGHNGRAFRGIGSILLEAGVLKPGAASMIAVREWLAQHPTEAADYMNRNTRYIFFRKLDAAEAADGPLGAQGVSLTPLRSMAVDPQFIPLGAPIWLDTVDPDGVPLQRLMVAQDIGAAITGPVRGDVFWGHGDEAFAKAGRMKSSGGYFIFVPQMNTAPAAQNQGETAK
jgi:membrane-bound lytic murein transglycosylase A